MGGLCWNLFRFKCQWTFFWGGRLDIAVPVEGMHAPLQVDILGFTVVPKVI